MIKMQVLHFSIQIFRKLCIISEKNDRSKRKKWVLSKYMAIVYFFCYFVNFNNKQINISFEKLFKLNIKIIVISKTWNGKGYSLIQS